MERGDGEKGQHLPAVVIGTKNCGIRAGETEKLHDTGFRTVPESPAWAERHGADPSEKSTAGMRKSCLRTSSK
jgi:hypothetical protein